MRQKFFQQRIDSIELLYLLFVGLTIIMIFFNFGQIQQGLQNLIRTRDALLTDYFVVGNMPSALLNTTLVMALVLSIKRYYNIEVNGFVLAAIMTVFGFSFFGKNFYNILPVLFGSFLYAKTMKKSFKNYYAFALFATGLAPLVTIGGVFGVTGWLTGIALAIGYGYIIVPLASHIIRFHSGYLLYNIGFSGGIIAMILTGFFRTLGFDVEVIVRVNTSLTLHIFFLLFLYGVSLYFLIVGCRFGMPKWREYQKILEQKGRAVTDFYRIVGSRLTYINVGIMGVILTTFVWILPVPLNGATTGAILSVMGFSAFGKHPKNTLPLILGAMIFLYFSHQDFSPNTVLTLIFVTGLAPIAGEFGFIFGLLAGSLHFGLVQYTAEWQAGINLYNNGFAGGFVAGVLSSLGDSLLRKNVKKNG